MQSGKPPKSLPNPRAVAQSGNTGGVVLDFGRDRHGFEPEIKVSVNRAISCRRTWSAAAAKFTIGPSGDAS